MKEKDDPFSQLDPAFFDKSQWVFDYSLDEEYDGIGIYLPDGRIVPANVIKETYRREQSAKYRRRYLNNPDSVKVRDAKRRALKMASGGTYSVDDIRLLIKGQTDKRGRLHCWWCECVIDDCEYHVDHRIPLAKSGTNSPENLCISCPSCNLRKGAKLPQEWNGRLL